MEYNILCPVTGDFDGISDCNCSHICFNTQEAKHWVHLMEIVGKLKKEEDQYINSLTILGEYSAVFVELDGYTDLLSTNTLLDQYGDTSELVVLPTALDCGLPEMESARTDFMELIINEDELFWQGSLKHSDYVVLQTTAIPFEIIKQASNDTLSSTVSVEDFKELCHD